MALNPTLSNLILLSLLLTMLVALRSQASETLGLFSKTSVEIINDLAAPPANVNLTVHCKSKNDDKGFQTLKLGESYSFGFRPSPVIGIASTLYFCSFTWPGQPSLHYFDIYDEDRDKCDFCSWKIWSNGACRLNEDSGLYNECYPWNKRKI